MKTPQAAEHWEAVGCLAWVNLRTGKESWGSGIPTISGIYMSYATLRVHIASDAFAAQVAERDVQQGVRAKLGRRCDDVHDNVLR